MKSKSLILKLLLLSVCAGILVTLPAAAMARETPKLLSCTTYSVGSTGYATSMGLMEAIKKNEGIKVKVVPAGTDKSKILPLKKGMMQLSLFTGAGQYYALMGLGDFSAKDWGPQPLRLVYACPEGSIAGMMVRKDSGIKTLKDLKGKKVAMIPASPACKALHEGYLAFAGAGLAGADPMKTGFKAMQFGFVKYFIPFFFVLNPAILLHGSVGNVLISFILVCCSVVCISYSLEGYVPTYGNAPLWMRIMLFAGGLCLGLPWLEVRLAGGVLVAAVLVIGFGIQKGESRVPGKVRPSGA